MKKISLLLFFFPYLYQCSDLTKPKSFPVSSSGKISIHKEDLLARGLPLAGDWEFYWNHSLQDLKKENSNPVFVPVPGIWREYPVSLYLLKGYGVYRLNVRVEDEISGIKLKIPRLPGIYEVYLNDTKVFSNGHPGKNSSDSYLIAHPFQTILSVPEKDFSLTVAVSNFHGNILKAGIRKPFLLSQGELLEKEEKKTEWLEIFLITVIFSFGLYHFVFYLSYRKDLTPFYFSLFCVIVSSYSFITSEIQYRMIPHLTLDLRIRAEFFCEVAFVPIVYLLFSKMFPNQYRSKWISYPIMTTIVFFSGIIFFSEAGVLELYQYYLYFPPLYAIPILGGIVQAIKEKQPKAITIFLTGLILAITMLNDVIYGLYEVYILFPYSFPIGLVGFVALNSYIISYRFTDDLERTKEFAQLQLRYNEQLKFQTEERSRIASDIHDSIGSELTAILFELEANGKKDQTLLKLKKEMSQLISNVRDIVFLMHHQGSKNELVEEVIIRYCKRIHETGRIQVHSMIGDFSGALKIDECLHVQKIFLEVMSNILRHGEAESIHVFWRKEVQGLILKISNDGKKFENPYLETKGIGLENIKMRAFKLESNVRFYYEKSKSHFELLIPR
ncbi:sensor histidine kinase [Leptospira ilyithenensis]|uniref:histidine kinase n=1 Tax=Leptospira ilyithenensis TaxID=2484901 RepID=A0A4R9LU41_9LEPT|nr:7TM diverse intracellular signaling domain-containing protein [Leptospira ilyithenensis]TGN10929.1 histidine kinase [Leptospira ilyithenensis]